MLDPVRKLYYKRLVRVETPNQARFLTFSCYQRLPLFLNDRIKDAFEHRLGWARTSIGFGVGAYVIMPEHVHLVIVPAPGVTVRRILNSVKGAFAKQVIRRWKQLDAPVLQRLRDPDGTAHFWLDGGGHDRHVLKRGELEEKIDYIHMNPVKRGLVSSPEAWKWSSYRWFRKLPGYAIECDRL